MEVWCWCLQRNIVIHAEHLPDKESVRADWESCHMFDCSDWRLDREGVQNPGVTVQSILSRPVRIPDQLSAPIYCSWRPDPTAWAVDALSIPWGNLNLYMFTPFYLIPWCLNKLRMKKAAGLLIVPVWQNQVWLP